jgi:hypothetical protein
LLGRHARFVVTQRSRKLSKPTFVSLPEAKWAAALLAGALATLIQDGYWAPEPRAWAAALVIMALPFLAAAWLTWAPRMGRLDVEPVVPVPGLLRPTP